MEIKSFIILLTNADTNSCCRYYGISRRCGRKTMDFKKRIEKGSGGGKHTKILNSNKN